MKEKTSDVCLIQCGILLRFDSCFGIYFASECIYSALILKTHVKNVKFITMIAPLTLSLDPRAKLEPR